MSLRPGDLIIRGVLEIGAVLGLALGGWNLADGPLRLLLALALPVLAAGLWGTFRVPGDPGPAPVAVPGAWRLALELGIFAAATLGWLWAGLLPVAVVFAGLAVGHYLMTGTRVRWLLGRR